MISDHSIASSVNTLEEYYDKLYKLQADAHGKDYMLVHNEIKEKIQGCNSYTELGVNQGATLAVAVLENIKTIRAYDIALKPYNFAKDLFNTYANDHNIDLKVFETDTLKCNIDPVDVLYIDTRHLYNHLKQELQLHGDKAMKYIIFHDTFAQSELKKAILEFVNQHSDWSVITDCKVSVGFMTIKKYRS